MFRVTSRRRFTSCHLHDRKVAALNLDARQAPQERSAPHSDLAASGGRASVRRGCTYVAQKPKVALTWENFP